MTWGHSGDRYALALEGSVGGVWDWNLLTGELYLSPRYKEILGYAEHELEASFSAVERLIHPAERRQAAALINDCVTGDAARFETEIRLQHRALHYVHTQIKGTIVRDGAGQVWRLVGTLNDVSQHRRDRRLLGLQYNATRTLAEATNMRDSVARWLQAIGQSGDWAAGCAWIVKGDALYSIAVWSDDLQDSGWNDRMKTVVMPGTATTMAVTTWKTGRPGWFLSVDSSDPTASAEFASCVTIPVLFAQRVVGAVQLFSHEVQQRDDEYLHVLYSTNAQIEQALIRRQIEKDLATAERQYREIVEQSVQGIYQSTRDGQFLSANASFARMLGCASVQELLDGGSGTARSMYLDPARRDEFVRLLDADGVVSGFEAQVRGRDGREIWISENARAVTDRATGRQYFEGFVEDISERKQSERLKSDFVSFATHQLRTPLSGIRWMLELAQGEKDVTAIAPYLEDARLSAERLISLVNDLLDVTRIEEGRLLASPQPTDLGELAASVTTELRPLAEEKGHTLVATLPGDLPPVLVDPQLARQVVLNLMSNAIKYTPDRGRITITLAAADGAVECSVADTGIGIPPAAQPRLFEKFYRADNAVAIDTEGTGLGLYLVRLIVERSGGRIACDSRPGAGSTFRFTLPQIESAVAAA